MPKIQKEKDVEELTGYLGTIDGASLRKQTNKKIPGIFRG